MITANGADATSMMAKSRIPLQFTMMSTIILSATRSSVTAAGHPGIGETIKAPNVGGLFHLIVHFVLPKWTVSPSFADTVPTTSR